MKKTKARKRGNKDAQEARRYLVVDYLKKRKGTHKEAAELFGLSKSGVDKIWTRYKAKGRRGLSNKKRGVRDGKKITGDQAAEVRRLIKDKMPDQLKLSFGLWTREAVQQLLLDRYGIALSRWQVGRYLKDWGYTPQKPIKKAFEQKPKEVKKWLEEEFPKIKKKQIKKRRLFILEMKWGCVAIIRQEEAMHPKGKHQ